MMRLGVHLMLVSANSSKSMSSNIPLGWLDWLRLHNIVILIELIFVLSTVQKAIHRHVHSVAHFLLLKNMLSQSLSAGPFLLEAEMLHIGGIMGILKLLIQNFPLLRRCVQTVMILLSQLLPHFIIVKWNSLLRVVVRFIQLRIAGMGGFGIFVRNYPVLRGEANWAPNTYVRTPFRSLQVLIDVRIWNPVLRNCSTRSPGYPCLRSDSLLWSYHRLQLFV